MRVLKILPGWLRRHGHGTPKPFPEGAALAEFMITHQGMAMTPWYFMKRIEAGVMMGIADRAPLVGDMVQIPEPGTCCGTWLLVKDPEPVRALTEAVRQSGALGWDGWRGRHRRKRVRDSGDAYWLYLKLSEGTTVRLYGYNACPEGFLDLLGQVRGIYHRLLIG